MTEVATQPMKSRKSWAKIVLVVILLLVVIFGAILLIQKSYTPKNGFITMSGTLQCLPKSKSPSNLAHSQECVIGLKGVDGRYYGLTGGSYLWIGTHSFVIVIGSLDRNNVSTKYDTAGTINIGTLF